MRDDAGRIGFAIGVDGAASLYAQLAGFRTVFTAFHHFPPAEARAILAAAVRDRRGIAIAEGAARIPIALASMLLVPLAVWLMTPAIRPLSRNIAICGQICSAWKRSQ